VPPFLFAVDSYEFAACKEMLQDYEMAGGIPPAPGTAPNVVEYKPHFHEWATVQPGMICFARKKKTAVRI